MMIRLAQMDDAAVLAQIDAAARERPWTEQQFAAMLAQTQYRVDVLEISGIAVGMAVWQICGGEAELHLLATVPESRRRGVAWALLRHVMDDGRLPRPLRMLLEVAESNVAAQALYQRAGFVATGRRKAYYTHADRLPEDAVLMEQTC